MGGLIKWAKHKGGQAWKEALGLARTAFNYAQHLAQLLGVLFGDVRGAWTEMVTAGLAVGRDLAHLARESYVALRWLYRTVIPKAIRTALGKAYTYVRSHVATAVRTVEHVLRRELGLVRTLANRIKATLEAEVRTLRRDIHDALTLGRKAFKLADEIANHPAHFAERLVAYLARPLGQYVLDHLPAILVYFGKHAVGLVEENATAVEKVLADLL